MRALVVGVGHLGKSHARVYTELVGVELAGVVDASASQAREIGEGLDVPYYTELSDSLLDDVHAVSVVTPTPFHHDVALRAIERGASVLVEKPITSTVEQARELVERAAQAGVTLQVGHIERFNPVVVAAMPHLGRPVFIECDRIHPFSFRSVETSVVLDLMIHDIDLVLHLVDSPVARLDAAGARILSETEDLASNRMHFANGCIAMFKASRVAIQKSRKMRIFCENAYVSLDYVAKTGMRIALKEGYDRGQIDLTALAALEATQGTLPIFTQFLEIEQLRIDEVEPLKSELGAFVHAVRSGEEPVVTGRHGLQALEVAMQILESIAANERVYLDHHRDSRR
jgi:predicted dehydrogenase